MDNKEYTQFARNEVRVAKQKLLDELRSDADGDLMVRMVEPMVESLTAMSLVLEMVSGIPDKVVVVDLLSRITVTIVDLSVRANSADKQKGHIAFGHATRIHGVLDKLLIDLVDATPSESARPTVEQVFNDVLRIPRGLDKSV